MEGCIMKLKLVAIAFSALCLGAALTQALPQTPPPGRNPRGTPADAPPARHDNGPSWEDTVNFLRQNSPNRLAMVQKLPENRQQGWKQFWVRQYAQIVALLDEGDTELAAHKTRQIKTDDDIFARVFSLGNALQAQPPDEARINELKGQLHDLARQKVESDIREREIRVARAENALAEAKEQLLIDKNKINQLIEEQFQRTLPRRQQRRDDGRDGHGGGDIRH
jgi:hypothetical protein